MATNILEEFRQIVREELSAIGASAPTNRLFGLKEAGAYIGGLTPDAVRHMVNTRVIPAGAVKKMGRRIFLDRIELDKWIKAR